ncbi:protein containing Alanyl-tRNA synthetase, class IIc [mine drainage metagenome]|uniref:Protein containing Alanyl-tRNA synthetase, class IIc n=1 Tax=mine drainage metagenome TaxID=410659 RepID=T1BUF2_9ZZZZ
MSQLGIRRVQQEDPREDLGHAPGEAAVPLNLLSGPPSPTRGEPLDALYLTDAYRREFSSRVVEALPGTLILETTAFYPQGGGQPCDQGTLHWGDGRTFQVLEVQKGPPGILRPGGGRTAAGRC